MTSPRDNVRVRFAPSPTGYLHVGGARTAIFNWVFARHTGGAFVLRIEDTDAERSTRASEAAVIEDLTWLGLEWDEGPGRGGDCGPYRQSERHDVYRRVVDDLLARRLAYPCFCSEEELERKRREALARGRPPQYDGTCRHLTPDQVAQRRAQGLAESIRFQVPPELVGFDDIVRGPLDFATSTVGDFVILRSNGLPTYNFAAAVDDHLMRITHVIRGEEHLPNTVRQMLVYEALGAEPPVFVHVPLIMGEDHSKLSKRHGASSIGELRAQGFLATATLNYLLLLGWSHPDGTEILALNEIVDSFTLDRIGKAPAVFDRRKLMWMNGQHIRRCDLDSLLPLARPFLPEAIVERFDEAAQREIVAVLQDSLETLSDLPSRASVFLDDEDPDADATAVLDDVRSRPVVMAMAEALAAESGPLAPEDFKASARAVGSALGVKGRDLYMPVRAAVTGSVHGPDLSRVVSIIGREAVIERLRRAAAS